jgi:DNA-binding CsgD family transcriptional regulator
MALSEAVSHLIGLIYQGFRDPVIWKSALDGLISITDSRFIMVSTVDLGEAKYASSDFHGADDALFLNGVKDYKDYKYQTDPTLAFGKANPDAGFVSMPMALAAIGEQYEDNSYAAWTGNVLGVGSSIVCYTQHQQNYILGVSLHPALARGSHSESEVRLFKMLFKHIEHSVRVGFDPVDLQSSAQAALLLTADGLISSHSQEAERVMMLNDGVEIRGRRLYFSDPRNEMRFGVLLRSACSAIQEGGAGGAMRVARPSGKMTWIVQVSPMPRPPAAFEALRPAAIVRIVNAAPSTVSPLSPHAAQLLGLTRTEALVAGHLKRGSGDDAIAGQLSVSVSTIRSHVRAILAKSEVRTKAELAHLLTILSPSD